MATYPQATNPPKRGLLFHRLDQINLPLEHVIDQPVDLDAFGLGAFLQIAAHGRTAYMDSSVFARELIRFKRQDCVRISGLLQEYGGTYSGHDGMRANGSYRILGLFWAVRYVGLPIRRSDLSPSSTIQQSFDGLPSLETRLL